MNSFPVFFHHSARDFDFVGWPSVRERTGVEANGWDLIRNWEFISLGSTRARRFQGP
jgi:hypothetical protein